MSYFVDQDGAQASQELGTSRIFLWFVSILHSHWFSILCCWKRIHAVIIDNLYSFSKEFPLTSKHSLSILWKSQKNLVIAYMPLAAYKIRGLWATLLTLSVTPNNKQSWAKLSLCYACSLVSVCSIKETTRVWVNWFPLPKEP